GAPPLLPAAGLPGAAARPGRHHPRQAGGWHLADAPAGERGASVSRERSGAKRMWGGRFQEETDALVQEFNASIGVDQALALQDIRGSVAHATMLAEQGILTAEEAQAIIAGLEGIQEDVLAGRFEWRQELEDVHMNVERALTDRIGPVG